MDKDIVAIVDETLAALRHAGYAECTVRKGFGEHYRRLIRFANSRGERFLTEELARDFLDETASTRQGTAIRMTRRALAVICAQAGIETDAFSPDAYSPGKVYVVPEKLALGLEVFDGLASSASLKTSTRPGGVHREKVPPLPRRQNRRPARPLRRRLGRIRRVARGKLQAGNRDPRNGHRQEAGLGIGRRGHRGPGCPKAGPRPPEEAQTRNRADPHRGRDVEAPRGISEMLIHVTSGTYCSGTTMRYLDIHTERLRSVAMEVKPRV